MKADYTLAYLRYLAGVRMSPPDAKSYGLSDAEATNKRTDVDRAVVCIKVVDRATNRAA